MPRVLLTGFFALVSVVSAAGGCSGCGDDRPSAPQAKPRTGPRGALVGSRALRAAVMDAGLDAGSP